MNIPTRITMHELLCLSKETRDALREVLADSEIFFTLVPPSAQEDCYCYHQVFLLPSITFSPEDMLVKNPNHDWLLYYTRYIGSTKVERILIDLGLALSIMPFHLMQFCVYPFVNYLLLPLQSMVITCKVADLSKIFD